MAKLPTKLKVAAFDISVEPLETVQQFAGNRYGDFNEVSQLIRVEKTQDATFKQLDTLIHETFHSIWWAYHLEDSDREERVVATFATGLTQVLRDNPKFLKYINEVLTEK